jgi:hypothetical protein
MTIGRGDEVFVFRITSSGHIALMSSWIEESSGGSRAAYKMVDQKGVTFYVSTIIMVGDLDTYRTYGGAYRV